MRKHSKALIAAMAAVSALLPTAVASPAAASATQCHLLAAGPTPAAEADTDGDGDVDLRVPSFRDVTLCVGADIVLTDAPSFWSEPCSEWGTCTRFFVHYGLSGYARTETQLCYTVDGTRACVGGAPLQVPFGVTGGTMCVGYDLAGGYPCSNGQLVAFE